MCISSGVNKSKNKKTIHTFYFSSSYLALFNEHLLHNEHLPDLSDDLDLTRSCVRLHDLESSTTSDVYDLESSTPVDYYFQSNDSKHN